MFGAYMSNKELMTVYFVAIIFLLVINLIINLVTVFKSTKISNKIDLKSTSISGKENDVVGS